MWANYYILALIVCSLLHIPGSVKSQPNLASKLVYLGMVIPILVVYVIALKDIGWSL